MSEQNPGQRDPFETLSRFGSQFEGGTMPLPAAEIRRRGDRIRRRRNAMVAGGAALAVAAVTVPVFALVGSGSGPSEVPPAGGSSSATTGSTSGIRLGTDDLVTSADLERDAGPGLSWTTVYSGPGEAQAAFSPCAQGPLVDLGASAVFQRDFVLTGDESGDGTDNVLDESVAQFDSAAEAQQAAATLRQWYDECSPAGAEDYRIDAWTEVDLGADGTGSWAVAQYGPPTAAPGMQYEPNPDEDWFMDTGIVVQGDRVAILTRWILGTDYNFLPEDGSPVAQLLPTMAERLRAEQPSP